MTKPSPSSPTRTTGRRRFLVVSSMAGGGLVLGASLRSSGDAQARQPTLAPAPPGSSFAPNAFIRISPEGIVTLTSKQMEVGQGVKTALPMALAEELEIDWQHVVVEQGDLNDALGNQFSGASSSVRNNYRTMRLLGATARTMLISAAAQAWGVPERECHAQRSAVHHRPSGRKLTYGALTGRAAALPVPSSRSVRLKEPKDFTLLGTRVGGVDNEDIVRGAPLFGIDLQLPGMLHAVYEKCPVFGGAVRAANLEEIKSMPGVRDAFVLPGIGGILGMQPGVAIVATTTWAALSARKKLKVEWHTSGQAPQSSQGFTPQARERSELAGAPELRRDGDVHKALGQAARTVEASYAYPFIAHAALEPLNCTASFKNGTMDLWTASQSPAWAHDHVSASLKLPKSAIRIHLLRSGGAFGRRLSSDYVVEAAAIAMRVASPVKLTWSREDDLQHDHYRANGFHRLRAGLDAAGEITAWHDHYVTSGSGGQPSVAMDGNEFPAGRVENFLLQQSVLDCGIPLGAWRAPGANVHAWVVQSFIDELAHAAGQDPLRFRLRLLSTDGERRWAGWFSRRGERYQTDRMRKVLETAAQLAGWGTPLPRGRGRGIAFHASYGGLVAQVAEVSVSPEGALRVERVVCACDVGEQILNLSGAEAQVQGSILDGLSAAWLQQITVEGGRVMQSNFHDYPLLRMRDAPPRIEVHFVRSDNPVSGLGEPALPPLAPAVCNAIFQATGHRVRELPLTRSHLAWG